MGANNIIYLQKRNNRYWVWMGLMSDRETPKPAKCDAKFYRWRDALEYAQEWLENAHVEYGFCELKDLA